MIATNIASGVSEIEAEALVELAEGKVCLELGAHYGFSTVATASVAARLVSVDWHMGDEQAGHDDSLYNYFQNLDLYRVREKVISIVGRFEDVVPLLRATQFDLVFVDGAHDLESVSRDATFAYNLCKSDGYIAFHDYGRFEVQEAVDKFCQDIGGAKIDLIDSLAIVKVV
jgi:predicted O-methyltransferase YrrM